MLELEQKQLLNHLSYDLRVYKVVAIPRGYAEGAPPPASPRSDTTTLLGPHSLKFSKLSSSITSNSRTTTYIRFLLKRIITASMSINTINTYYNINSFHFDLFK
jgi:hypothetical protein